MLHYDFCFMFWFFGHKTCGILAPQPEIEPMPLALEGKVLTTGPPGKPLDWTLECGRWTGQASSWGLVAPSGDAPIGPGSRDFPLSPAGPSWCYFTSLAWAPPFGDYQLLTQDNCRKLLPASHKALKWMHMPWNCCEAEPETAMWPRSWGSGARWTYLPVPL